MTDRPPAGLPFAKWEGLGNDFVVVEGPPPPAPVASAWAQHLCHRQRGVGADGLAFLTDDPGMVIYNADGSPAQMCGNALRCLGAAALQAGRLRLDEAVTFATAAGPREVRVLRQDPRVWWVEVDMGQPSLRPRPMEFLWRRLPMAVHLASVGNPHAVLLHPLVPPADWEECGRSLQRAPFAEFDGINVEFVTATADALQVWVYERGVGPTLACGTGACAAFAVAHSEGLCPPRGRVELPGGILELEWQDPPHGAIRMRGPAREVYRGNWTGN